VESKPQNRRTKLWPVYIALAVLIVFAAVFAVELVQLSRDDRGVEEGELTEQTYMDTVNRLLRNADPARGPDLVQEHGCNACHGGSNADRLAPGFADLWEVADERHPPLTGPAYVYESIVYPGAYIVEGYPSNMPRIYAERIPDDELGHIIAYLIAPPESET
jgi:hypothetical protein